MNVFEHEIKIVFSVDQDGEGWILHAPKEAWGNNLLYGTFLSDNIHKGQEIPTKIGVYEAVLHISGEVFGGHEEPENMEFTGSLYYIKQLWEYPGKKVSYVVTACRWGRRSDSYLVASFDEEIAAIRCAEDHTTYRGGKYSCYVDRISFNRFNNDDLRYSEEIYVAKGMIM